MHNRENTNKFLSSLHDLVIKNDISSWIKIERSDIIYSENNNLKRNLVETVY